MFLLRKFNLVLVILKKRNKCYYCEYLKIYIFIKCRIKQIFGGVKVYIYLVEFKYFYNFYFKKVCNGLFKKY